MAGDSLDGRNTAPGCRNHCTSTPEQAGKGPMQRPDSQGLWLWLGFCVCRAYSRDRCEPPICRLSSDSLLAHRSACTASCGSPRPVFDRDAHPVTGHAEDGSDPIKRVESDVALGGQDVADDFLADPCTVGECRLFPSPRIHQSPHVVGENFRAVHPVIAL